MLGPRLNAIGHIHIVLLKDSVAPYYDCSCGTWYVVPCIAVEIDLRNLNVQVLSTAPRLEVNIWSRAMCRGNVMLLKEVDDRKSGKG